MREERGADGVHGVEVEEVWPRDGQIRLCLAVVGGGGARAVLVLKVRGEGGGEVRLPVDGGSGSGDGWFGARIPLELLGASCDVSEQVWDLYLDVGPGGGLLRLGRHLDDVVGKKKIFVYPAQLSAGVWVEPYYTVKDNLSIACRREAQ
ncbi:hypothetical protein ABZV77_39825 [Streptomyces sp. NPDC004732]|uniref:hypothetical protein n=1 Tax=Streptomyces sp. NPDC004732 TaxID=3154290 RepID=UPI0033B92961